MSVTRKLLFERSFKYRDYEVFKLGDSVELPASGINVKLAEKIYYLMAVNIEISYLRIKQKVDELVKLGNNPEVIFAMLEEEKINTQDEINKIWSEETK
jgi:hypothetical protein